MTSARKLISLFPHENSSFNWADWGCDVTIAMAVVTIPEDVIVCVSDRMISFGDSFQGDDNAMLKAIRISDQWELAWAANNINLIPPIIAKVREQILDNTKWDGRDAAQIIADAYSEALHKEFTAQYLSRFGYKTVEQFRTEGRADLGDHFTELCIELSRFNLGVAFILFGHDQHKRAQIFEINDPGRVLDRNMLKYAVIGSGHDMAFASLRSRYSQRTFVAHAVYDLLCAKFSAETATGVGLTTTVILRNRDGIIRILPRSEIDKIRDIWDETRKLAHPLHAIEILERSKAIGDVAGQQ